MTMGLSVVVMLQCGYKKNKKTHGTCLDYSQKA